MHAGASPGDLDDYLTWGRDVVFTDSAASASIRVHFDSAGGFVIADAGQQQIRVYSDDATLLWAAGRQGPGPTEFQQLRSAVRTSAGDVLALDIRGKLSVFGPNGELERTVPTGLNPTYNTWLISDSTLLISGRRAEATNSPLLHVWDLRRDSIVASFFEVPPHDPSFDEAYRFTGWASATVLGGDSIAVVFPLADTLYLYRTDGTELGRLRLPLDRFRRLRDPHPRNDSPEARIEWRNSYTRLAQVFRSPDGALYVQYFDLDRIEPVWGLARFFLDRGRLHKTFDVPNTPRLLGISDRDSSLYFLRADLLESTVWSVARSSR